MPRYFKESEINSLFDVSCKESFAICKIYLFCYHFNYSKKVGQPESMQWHWKKNDHGFRVCITFRWLHWQRQLELFCWEEPGHVMSTGHSHEQETSSLEFWNSLSYSKETVTHCHTIWKIYRCVEFILKSFWIKQKN